MRSRILLLVPLSIILLAGFPTHSFGQSSPASAADAPAPALNVYLDCRTGGCDRDLFLNDVRFISLTRDRADADVHLMITALGNGAGGRELTFQFIGLGQF